jgi:hypothetical protein
VDDPRKLDGDIHDRDDDQRRCQRQAAATTTADDCDSDRDDASDTGKYHHTDPNHGTDDADDGGWYCGHVAAFPR